LEEPDWAGGGGLSPSPPYVSWNQAPGEFTRNIFYKLVSRKRADTQHKVGEIHIWFGILSDKEWSGARASAAPSPPFVAVLLAGDGDFQFCTIFFQCASVNYNLILNYFCGVWKLYAIENL
jgi:hypothetical protein